MNWNRMIKRGIVSIAGMCAMHASMAQRAVPSAYPSGMPVSFVRTWDLTAPVNDGNAVDAKPLKDAKMTTAYVDGLGRPLQTVIKQGSLDTKGGTPTDMVSPVEYDEFGRERFKYSPYADASANDGSFKMDPFASQATFMSQQYSTQGEAWYYSQINFEPSPLNRLEKSMAAGNNWVGTGRGVEAKYWINTVTDAVRIWTVNDVAGSFGTYQTSATYAAGELYKNVTVDEHGKQVIEFKDMEGKMILKKVQLTATADAGTGSDHPGWLCTYYIYDDLDNLRSVIQPEGVKSLANNSWPVVSTTILNEQFFRYEYDKRGRMIKKKVPGGGEVCMVYDNRDRLVMTQDANMRNQQQWMYTTYDEQNRPVSTGLINDNNSHVYHLNAAYNSIAYPNLGAYMPDELTRTFYDNYTWLGNYGNPLPGTYNSSYDSYFQTPSNTTWPYPQANVQDNQLKGMATGSRIKVLGSSIYLYNVIFYDAKGRTIQTQATNITTGVDINTTQYTWAGQPLVLVQQQQKANGTSKTCVIATALVYDDLGRVITVKKAVSDLSISKPQQVIVQNGYDKFGLLKTKKLGNKATVDEPVETLNYDYNIRGWMLGMNRDYLTTTGQSSTSLFGFELGYDKLSNSSGHNFTTGQYNGNITGMVWKSDGDDVKRKYDFSYDAANRLMKGLFEQDDAQNNWNATTMNYSMQMGDGTNPSTAYDANGNILAMKQYGWKLGVPPASLIDDLSYNYFTGSNKLKNVADVITADNKLGDFTDKNATAEDYGYDKNGNLVTDLNKRMNGATGIDITAGGSITYNHLNLPAQITVKNDNGTDKGTIIYTYDAVGNKLQKAVSETGQPAKTTLYLGGVVYENDVLQFIGQEEGRIRFKPTVSLTPASFEYDYFVKDHLGNVRMVLTEEQKVDQYPAATMETAPAATEEALYANLPQTRVDKPTGYPTDNTTNPNDKVAKTNGNGNKIGPSITLKVMAGDKFNLKVSSWYKTNGASPGTPTNPLPDLLTALINGISGAAVGVHAITPTELQNSGVLTPGATGFLNNQSTNSNGSRPQAFLNWILFDEQFKIVNSSSGFEQVGDNEEFKLHVKNNLSVDRNGYLYIYVGNSTPNIDVFFDNLQVTHIRGSLLEETHYYPFGLTMAGISSTASKFGKENKYKLGGKEIQTRDFADGTGIDVYDFSARNFDPQIGRWWSNDPISDKMPGVSPYNYAVNNPILFFDPNGKFPIIIHVRSFAPYDRFGPMKLWVGDGYSRGFTTSMSATSRLRQETYLETSTGRSSTTYFGSVSIGLYLGPYGSPLVADSEPDNYLDVHNSFNMSTHLSGNDDAVVPGLDGTALQDLQSPDIDVFSDFGAKVQEGWSLMGNNGSYSSISVLNITGDVKGDGFPSAESFVSDKAGNSIFLGVYGTPANRGPSVDLWGAGQQSMMKFNVRIVVDNNGIFLGVLNGRKTEKGYNEMIGISEWNKQFEQQSTRGESDFKDTSWNREIPWL